MELLERKGLCTKQELYDIIEELRSRHLAALQDKILLPDFEDTARIENKLIDLVLELIKAVGPQACSSTGTAAEGCCAPR